MAIAEFSVAGPLEDGLAVGVLAFEEPGSSLVWRDRVRRPFALLRCFLHAGYAAR